MTLPDYLQADPDRMAKAQALVDAAPTEAYELALWAIYDVGIQFALLRRAERDQIGDETH